MVNNWDRAMAGDANGYIREIIKSAEFTERVDVWRETEWYKAYFWPGGCSAAHWEKKHGLELTTWQKMENVGKLKGSERDAFIHTQTFSHAYL